MADLADVTEREYLANTITFLEHNCNSEHSVKILHLAIWSSTSSTIHTPFSWQQVVDTNHKAGTACPASFQRSPINFTVPKQKQPEAGAGRPVLVLLQLMKKMSHKKEGNV